MFLLMAAILYLGCIKPINTMGWINDCPQQVKPWVIPVAPISAQELDLNWPPCRKPFAYKIVGRLVDIRPSILNAKAGASFPASMENDPNRGNILGFAAKLFSSEAWLSMELL